jgi:hypothetical protein
MVIRLPPVFNSANAGRGRPLTYNQAILSCWGRTTWRPYIGLQLSSREPIQEKTASSKWLQLGPPREFLSVPQQKFVPYYV